MNPGPFFSFIFFFMLILLGISSSSCGWEVLIASITDEFPRLRRKRVTVMVFSCLAAFLLGFPICFESGSLLFQLMDNRYKIISYSKHSSKNFSFQNCKCIISGYIIGVNFNVMGLWCPKIHFSYQRNGYENSKGSEILLVDLLDCLNPINNCLYFNLLLGKKISSLHIDSYNDAVKAFHFSRFLNILKMSTLAIVIQLELNYLDGL